MHHIHYLAFYPRLVPQAQGPHSHIFLMGGGGVSNFFGSVILAKSDFFGSMKYAGIFLGHKKKGIFWGCEKWTKGFFGVC